MKAEKEAEDIRLWYLSPMQTSATRLIVTWVLLLGWLLCGGVVLAEQLEVKFQTTEQESQACEEALENVGQALKPAADTENSLPGRDCSVAIRTILHTVHNVPPNPAFAYYCSRQRFLTPLASNTASLLCTYRI